jgi:uncharacterized protein
MPGPVAAPQAFDPPAADARFYILAIDGGGIRGVIATRVLAHLDRLLADRPGAPALGEAFQLVAGTSTGGLLALGLTVPRPGAEAPLSAADLVDLYEGAAGRRIFDRPWVRRLPLVGAAIDLVLPKYSPRALRAVLSDQFGEATLADSVTAVMVTAYDLSERRPIFFKGRRRKPTAARVVDVGLATSAAPTYFPPHELAGRALVDGGVFAANPTVAAIVEALKRTEGPGALRPHDLLVVSLGTGRHETSYRPAETRGWGAADWALPRRGADPPLIGAMLDGQSDAADHWAHVLLNHEPGEPIASRDRIGAGPRYFRLQVDLPRPVALDDASPASVALLGERADALIEARATELAALADALARRVDRSPG